MRYILSIMLLFSVLGTNAADKGKPENSPSKLTFGLEWGHVVTLRSAYHYDYFIPDGYRVEDRGKSGRLIGNMEVYANIGYDLNAKWNLSAYLGYEGITDIHDAIPVSLRMTRYFNEKAHGDQWFTFADIGSGIGLKNPLQEILTGKLGGGYRLSLSRRTSLDFLISARFTYTHPEINYDNKEIPMSQINMNAAYLSAFSFGMALNF